jgi:excisionase family DNA binding protein
MYDTDSERMLSVKETSVFLGLNDQYTRELFRKGVLPGAVRFGRVYRIAQSDLSRYLEKRRVVAA